jgi:hypothetical protein
MQCNIDINIEFYDGPDGQHVYIAEENSSGCDYKVDNLKDVMVHIEEYIRNRRVFNE